MKAQVRSACTDLLKAHATRAGITLSKENLKVVSNTLVNVFKTSKDPKKVDMAAEQYIKLYNLTA